MSFGNWPSSAGNHLSLIVADLEHRLEVRSQSTQFESRTESSSSCRSWPISAGSDVSWLAPT